MRFVSIGNRHSAVTASGSSRDRSVATAEPVDGFAPLSEVLLEMGTTLGMLLAVAVAGYVILFAFGIF